MLHEELLGTLAEVGVTFAGFASLVSVVGARERPQRGFEFYDRVAMIGFSVQAAGFALLPRVLAALLVPEPVAWRASSCAMSLLLVAWSLYGASRRRLIAKAEGVSGRAAVDTLTRIGIVGGVLVGVLAVLLTQGPLAGVYVAALFWMLLSSAVYFVRMLVPPVR